MIFNIEKLRRNIRIEYIIFLSFIIIFVASCIIQGLRCIFSLNVNIYTGKIMKFSIKRNLIVAIIFLPLFQISQKEIAMSDFIEKNLHITCIKNIYESRRSSNIYLLEYFKLSSRKCLKKYQEKINDREIKFEELFYKYN